MTRIVSSDEEERTPAPEPERRLLCYVLAAAAIVMIALAVGLAVIVLTSSKAAAATPETVIKLEPYRKTVALRVTANGKTGLFTLDTAGGITIVSPKFAQAIGCKPWGELVGFQMTGNRLAMPRCENVRLTAGSTTLAAPVAGVLDVTPLVAKDAAPVDGSVALDVFAGKAITLDAAALTLTIENPDSLAERVAGARELPVRVAREVGGRALSVFLQVPTPKGPVGLEIDSGNGGTILVSKAVSDALGILASDKPRIGRVHLARGIDADGLIFTPDLTIDGNLGMPFLKYWVVTLDLDHGRMWLKRSAATPPKGMGEAPPLPKD